jgi:hypothetical protein
MWSVEAMKAHSVAQLLVGVLDEVWDRQRARMAGLTQEEYLWEPVPDCWSVTQRDGGWHVPEHQRPDPVPAPVTTIAWRLWHIASDCLADYTVRGLGPRPIAVSGSEWYGDVGEALAALDQAWTGFRAGMDGLGDDGMWSPLGEQWGPYAPEPWAALGVHALDEVAHHGAEIGLLRDLYAHRVAR